MSKKTVWSIIAVMIIIIGAFAILSLLPKTIEHAASESVMAELTEHYLDERAKQQELIQFTNERFGQIKFIQEADMKMLQLKNELSNPINREELELEVQKIIESIQFPSEMIKEVDNKPLLMDEEKSIAYFIMYSEKIKDLIDIFDQIIWDHREEIENFEADSPEQKTHMMMLTRSSFSDELQNAIKQMRYNSIELCANSLTGEIKSCYYWSHFHEQMMNGLHPHLRAYFFLLIDGDSFGFFKTYPTFEIDFLMEAQNTLMHIQQDDILYPLLEKHFIRYFMNLMKATETNSIFNERGIVKHEIQELWKNLFNFDSATPLNYLLKPIIEEMEASGWTESEHWNALNRDKILEALTLGRDGLLEEVMYGKPPVLESHVINWPNDDFLAEVEHLYLLFKLDYDKKIFKNMSPLYIVGVFDYANEMEDPETMYHLLYESTSFWNSESGGNFSLDNFKKRWLKGFSFFEDATEIRYEGDSFYRIGVVYHSGVDIKYEGNLRVVGVVIDKEGIWHMLEVWHTPLPKYDEISNIEIELLMSLEMQYYYERLLNGDPVELSFVPATVIAGLYFHTAEIGDFESQYKLLFQDENHQIDKDEFIRNAKDPKYTLEEYFTSVSFQGQDQDEDGNWPGIATFNVNLENFLNEKPQKEFKMMWTRQGWRVQMNPME